jgi:DNA-directed RNA polymerase specialized sigma24 family protein
MNSVDCALEAWARWGREGMTLGWPAWTILAKVASQGFTGAAQKGPTPEMGEAIEAVERAVLTLKAIERQVVVKHYVSWEPVEVSARRCHMSANRFRVVLYRARRKIADLLHL